MAFSCPSLLIISSARTVLLLFISIVSVSLHKNESSKIGDIFHDRVQSFTPWTLYRVWRKVGDGAVFLK